MTLVLSRGTKKYRGAVKYSRGQVTYIRLGRRCVSRRCCRSETIVTRVTVVRRRSGDRDLRMRSTSGLRVRAAPCVLRLARYRYRGAAQCQDMSCRRLQWNV